MDLTLRSGQVVLDCRRSTACASAAGASPSCTEHLRPGERRAPSCAPCDLARMAASRAAGLPDGRARARARRRATATAAGRRRLRYGRHGSASRSSSAGLRQLVEPVGAQHRPADAQVADGQHVGALEVEDQEHVGGPGPDALDGDELGHDARRRARRGGRARASRRARARPASAGRPPWRATARRRRAAPRGRRPGPPPASAGGRRSARAGARRSRARPWSRAAGRRSRARARRSGRRARPAARRGAAAPMLVDQPRSTGSAPAGARGAADRRAASSLRPGPRPRRARRCWSSTWAGSSCSGRMWCTACATAIAASAKPVAISLSLPSNVVMSPQAQTRSRLVFITGSTTIAPLLISKPQSFSGPSAVLNPSWSRMRVDLDLDLVGPRPRSGRARRARSTPLPGHVLDLEGHVQVDRAASAGLHDLADRELVGAEALAPVHQRDRARRRRAG